MSRIRSCTECGHGFVFSEERCPHCARPGLYPNVYAAQDATEVDALRARYDLAKREAQSRGAGLAVERFEAEVSDSRAVIARSENELQRLLTTDSQVYATFYQLVDAGIRLPCGDEWDVLRALADDALFPGYKTNIRFAALTLDGKGLTNFGDCFIVLRTEMISHRASVFEENSVLFMEHHDVKIGDAHRLPYGYRAEWGERAKLCVAKLAARIDAGAQPPSYSGLLLRQGTADEKDDFVEVHIWGPLTILTVEQVIFHAAPQRRARAIINKANRQRLAKYGVTVG